MKKISLARRHLKAQGLVEFALVLPIVLLLLFGVIDLSWMVFNFSQLYNSLREGTRFGSVAGFDAAAPQDKDCSTIKGSIVTRAGFSGITSSQINIWYDDGRPLDDATLGTNQTNVVGTCGAAFAYNASYSPSRTSQDIQNGDRIVIDVNVNVKFLTPFFQSMAPSGVNMHLRVARSIFPDGLAS